MLPSASHPAPGMASLVWDAQPDSYRPDYGRCLTGVYPTLLRLLGATPDSAGTLTEWLPTDSPREARRVLLMVVDAFGFKELAQSNLFAALYARHGTWITSVFPTITSTCLSSMHLGLPPARHGVAGHVVWHDAPGAVLDMLRMQVQGATATLQDSGFAMRLLKPEPGVVDNGLPAGLKRHQLMHRQIVGSGLSSLIYGSTPLVGFMDPLEGLRKAGRMIEAMDWGWVGFYTEMIDTLVHVIGGDAPEVAVALGYLEAALRGWARALPGGVLEETALMVVADHGQSTITERLPFYGKSLAWLQSHTASLGHSGRVLHVTPRPGEEEAVAGWLREFVGNSGRVYSGEEVRPLGGPPAGDPAGEAAYRRSLGSQVAVLNPGINWQKSDPAQRGSPFDSQLVSQHGALGWDEMFIPFICAPATALLEG